MRRPALDASLGSFAHYKIQDDEYKHWGFIYLFFPNRHFQSQDTKQESTGIPLGGFFPLWGEKKSP